MKTWKPHPKQEMALMSLCFETLYGGARGGGKTDAGMVWLLYGVKNPGYRAIVIRKNHEDLKDWLDRARVMYSKTGANFSGKPEQIEFPSGAIIRTGHLKDDKAYTKYQGHEYQRILIEELTHIPSEKLYLQLISSCRSTVEGLKPRIFATTNPGEVGHEWVKKRFIAVSRPTVPFTDPISGRTRVYIPATVSDNPTLTEKDPDYVSFLESLPEDLKARWRFGSWEDIEVKGGIFHEDIRRLQKEGRICSLALDDNAKVYTSWDLGWARENGTQVCWFFRKRGREIEIIDLIYGDNQRWDYFLKSLDDKGYRYATHFLPHDGVRMAPNTLRSFKDTMESAGHKVVILGRTKDKENDIQLGRAMLPRCFFDEIKTEHGVSALLNYRREWKEDTLQYGAPKHDWASHFADAFMGMTQAIRKLDEEMRNDSDLNEYSKIISQINHTPPPAPGMKLDEWNSYQNELKNLYS